MEHKLELTDILVISENQEKSGNNINLVFGEAVTIIASPPEIYKIIRVADTAFARTDYP